MINRFFIWLACLLLLLGAGLSQLSASVDLSAEIPELTLANGTVLHGVVIKAYNRQGVMVRHRDGIAQLKYTEFPPEYQEALEAKKPVESPDAPNEVARRPSVAKVSARNDGPLRPCSGAILGALGGKAVPLAGVEVRGYLLNDLVNYDLSRRHSFSAKHDDIRTRVVEHNTQNPASADEVEYFYAEEYQSWSGLPATKYMTRTNEDGTYAFSLPARANCVVFARADVEGAGGHHSYLVWVIRANGPEVNCTPANTFPAFKVE